MTGWRVGYAAGPTNIINAMNKVQSQNVSSTASISMAASVEALTGDQSFITSHNESFLRRRDLVVKHLKKLRVYLVEYQRVLLCFCILKEF
ncbi:MAG: hypothetical protein CM15mP70_04970 [Pelagibacteraceae bacterium]|nr:MAG: hypothetical protein CM15mP70_04970 [Pelagibacteraceae bacterium]